MSKRSNERVSKQANEQASKREGQRAIKQASKQVSIEELDDCGSISSTSRNVFFIRCGKPFGLKKSPMTTDRGVLYKAELDAAISTCCSIIRVAIKRQWRLQVRHL